MSKLVAQPSANSSDKNNNLEDYLGIPVTIITGFLGAGKTTLLNHILCNQKGLKTAVLVNEFGEIGIDNELILNTSEEMIELSNGCICCSINGELLKTVKKVLEKPTEIEYLIIETTGLADPLPIAMTFLSNELRELTRLDSIITLIDADNFNCEMLNSDVALAQVIYGDILLLNKCDLVSENRLSSIEKELRETKQDARILKSVKGEVSLSLLLSVGLFETDRIKSKQEKSDHDHIECEHEHDKHSQSHLKQERDLVEDSDNIEIEGFTSLSFESESPLSLRKFQSFLDNQLPANIFRAKGILWFIESDRRHIFHLAGKRFSIDDSNWQGKQKNQIVLIGRHLNHSIIRNQLQACVVPNTRKDS